MIVIKSEAMTHDPRLHVHTLKMKKWSSQWTQFMQFTATIISSFSIYSFPQFIYDLFHISLTLNTLWGTLFLFFLTVLQPFVLNFNNFPTWSTCCILIQKIPERHFIKKLHFFWSVKIFHMKVLIGTLFLHLQLEMGPPFYMVIWAMQRSSCLQCKGSAFISQLF